MPTEAEHPKIDKLKCRRKLNQGGYNKEVGMKFIKKTGEKNEKTRVVTPN